VSRQLIKPRMEARRALRVPSAREKVKEAEEPKARGEEEDLQSQG
jgi:hypothetical protein